MPRIFPPLSIAILVCLFSTVHAQVGINTTTPKAQLEIQSSNQATPANTDGILIPKIDAFPGTDPTAAQDGMMVYLTTGTPTQDAGFYYWDQAASQWSNLGGGGDGWSLTGNGGTNASVNFIGTTDDIDVIFKRNNTYSGKLHITETAFGLHALNTTSTGENNTAVGVNSLTGNTDGDNNTAIGVDALENNKHGSYNTGIARRALFSNANGNHNVAIGYQTLEKNSNNSNTAIGNFAAAANTSGNNNTAVGYKSLEKNQEGVNNTALGYTALQNNRGDNNTAIGYNAFNPYYSEYFDNSTAIGNGATISASNQVKLGNNAVTEIGGYADWTNYTPFASTLQKSNIQVPGLAFIEKLEPVTYQSNSNDALHSKTTSGFVAQAVEKAANELGYDFSGVVAPRDGTDVYGIQYAQFIMPLVQAVKEQQDIIEEQEEETKALQTQVTALTERLEKVEALLTE